MQDRSRPSGAVCDGVVQENGSSQLAMDSGRNTGSVVIR